MSKQEHNRAFYRWLSVWLTACLIVSFVSGGVNCRCPEEPGGEYKPDSGGATVSPDDCYCVKPGSPCEIDGDCRTRLKYCIFLVCQKKTCLRPAGSAGVPDTSPTDTAKPEAPQTDLPPTCPSRCTTNADCAKKLCGDGIICSNKKCSPLVVP